MVTQKWNFVCSFPPPKAQKPSNTYCILILNPTPNYPCNLLDFWRRPTTKNGATGLGLISVHPVPGFDSMICSFEHIPLTSWNDFFRQKSLIHLAVAKKRPGLLTFRAIQKTSNKPRDFQHLGEVAIRFHPFHGPPKR